MGTTVNRLFHDAAAKYGPFPALSRKVAGRYEPITYADLARQVCAFGRGLVALGIEKGDRVAIISENRPEWAVADLGMLSIGVVNVPLFVSLAAEQIAYVVSDSGARALIVSDEKLLARCELAASRCPSLRLILMEPPAEADPRITPFAEVLRLADESPLDAAAHGERLQSIGPDDLASIIYTSGTTGEPKGVELTHWNFASNVLASQAVLRFGTDDVLLSFLPLNHVFERLAAYYLALSQGSMVAYTESLRRLRDNMREVEPTMMLLVPRVYEVFQETITDRIAGGPTRARRVFEWASGVGRRRTALLDAGLSVPPWLAAKWWLARKVVLDRARGAMGLRRLRYFVSGGAALPRATAEFFHSIGLPILEGYGLTETSPVVSVNRPQRFRLGTVGLPLQGVEVRVAQQGEILVRGPNVMCGYHNRPEATAEAIDSEGWFHTGDIGAIDEDGYITITDRLKDLLVLANGKNVAPQQIENRLSGSPYITQAVVLGDGRPAVTALIVPAFQRVEQWAARQGQPELADRTALCADKAVRKLFRDEISRLTADVAEYERVTRFTLLDHDLSIESGQLTPTLKVRRKVVQRMYADEIRTMYGDS